MASVRLSLRFIIPLIAVLSLIAYGIIPIVDQLTLKWSVRDIDVRATLVVNTIEDSFVPLIKQDSRTRILMFFNRITNDERLFALGFCNQHNEIAYKTPKFPEQIQCDSESGILRLQRGPLHVAYRQIGDGPLPLGTLVLVHDLSFVERRSADTKKYIFGFFVGLGIVISFITVLIARLSWKGWVSGIRHLLKGEGLMKPLVNVTSPELQPIAKDLRKLIRELDTDRKARDESQMTWTPRTLKNLLRQELSGDQVLIVSNREPYIHVYRNNEIEIQVPASGVVTALEPVMRACSGTWIAYGSGDADKAVVDDHDHVRVPPNNPSYQIRRVWLTPEEQDGYYYGFANEGIWPLCHIAHVRPTFRSGDWNHYVEVNRKFTQAVVEEAKSNDPVVLLQDYHFALAPQMIKEKLPEATVIMFWHIPWPNPEAFGICPWREELLNGLLGSNILGFHTQFHCHNFVDTVDRYLESRIDWETFTIFHGGQLTAVNPYPISIEYPSRLLREQKSVEECRRSVREQNGLSPECRIGIGVDRLDYTKGILERFLAVERFLELYPAWVGKFTFIQIASPSRSRIPQYQQFDSEVRAMAERINHRFSNNGYRPICLKIEHHEPAQIMEYYRGADLCMVSSLHDGMNLVAKEFVASRDDERGVLILSQFTGASRELAEALIVNPYYVDQCATALNLALEMPEREQRDRIRSMRGLIQEFNVYRWAGRMLLDAARIRRRRRYESSVFAA
jgi:trehalose-6-phosphate synthase